MNKRSVGFLALTFFLGILVGSVLGRAIGLFLPPDGVAHQLFVASYGPGFDATKVDLIFAHLTIGLQIHVNLMSVVGVFVVAQLLRWFR